MRARAYDLKTKCATHVLCDIRTQSDSIIRASRCFFSEVIKIIAQQIQILNTFKSISQRVCRENTGRCSSPSKDKTLQNNCLIAFDNRIMNYSGSFL